MFNAHIEGASAEEVQVEGEEALERSSCLSGCSQLEDDEEECGVRHTVHRHLETCADR